MDGKGGARPEELLAALRALPPESRGSVTHLELAGRACKVLSDELRGHRPTAETVARLLPRPRA